MKLIRRCTFCESIWVDWNIRLEMTNEPVYAHYCYECGRIHLTGQWIHRGMPYPLLAIAHRVQITHKNGGPRHAKSRPAGNQPPTELIRTTKSDEAIFAKGRDHRTG